MKEEAYEVGQIGKQGAIDWAAEVVALQVKLLQHGQLTQTGRN
jgi:hypothetical protein